MKIICIWKKKKKIYEKKIKIKNRKKKKKKLNRSGKEMPSNS